MTTSAPPQTLIDEYSEAWASRDPDRIAAHHAEDGIFQLHSGGAGPVQGRDAIRESFAGLLAQYPELAFVEQELQPAEWGWAARWTITGTPVQIDAVDVITVSGGLITAKHTYLDLPEHDPGVEDWVAGFAAGWAEPSDADEFAAHFEPMLAEDIRLVQPQLPTTVGKRAFREQFARPLFALLTDVRGTVESWASSGDVAFIELSIRGRLGSREVELRTVDKVTVRDGMAVKRVAYTDPLPMLQAVALTPRAWPTFVRIQIGNLVKR
jgi:uncharacterized protein (TIGR02246 family)